LKKEAMMKRMMLAAGLVATAGWLMLAQATAQQPPRPAAPPPGAGQFPGATATLDQQRGGEAVPMNPKNDHEFIEWVATRNAMEVELGNMAARKAPSQQVRQFAQMMATDHGRNNAKVLAFARQMNIRLPENMSPQDRRTIQEFTRLQGPQFDQRFMQHMVHDHQHTLSVFEKFAKNAKDPEIRRYAEQTLPALKKHLDAAKRLAGEGRNSGTEEQENHHGQPGSTDHNTRTDQDRHNTKSNETHKSSSDKNDK
jgi:putative membrane protein